VFGELVNSKLAGIGDLNWREVAIFAPLIVGTLALGVYPKAVFFFTDSAVGRLIDLWRAGAGG